MKRITLCLILFIALITMPLSSAVVINEFAYDDTSTDNLEYVELYNSGASAEDISGWTVEFGDTGVDNTVAVPASTSLAAGDYYVIGSAAVPNVDQVMTNTIQNDMEFIALRNSSSALQDSVVYERNKGNIIIPAGLGEPPFDGVSATSGGGIWSNAMLIESGSVELAGMDFDAIPNASFAWCRHADGQDSNNNELDFGMQIASPGLKNNVSGTINALALPYINNFDVADNTILPDFAGNYATGCVQDPLVADVLGVGSQNPNTIAPSPQGGNCMIFWDSSGGGDAGVFNLSAPVQNIEIECYVYLPLTHAAGTDVQEGTWVVVRGHVDQLYNTGTANGDVGIRWRWSDDATNGLQVFLEERKDGITTPLGATIPVATGGWFRLYLKVDGTAVTGIFGGTYGTYTDGTIINATATINQFGGIGMGYREVVTDNTMCRPNTYDGLVMRSPTTSVADWFVF